MNAPARPESGRLLTFEVLGHVWALPIHGILEVAEPTALCGVPTLPRSLAGVMNWHGEALPIVAPRLLVERTEVDEDASDAPAPAVDAAEDAARDELAAAHVLVVSSRSGETPSFGLPIDAVLGLVPDAPRGHVGTGTQVVVERRQVDGRVVSVLDPRRLVARAREVIERLAA